ncbi:TPA: Rha family transcriptional regulator [Bacillus cereus]|uniref:Rha family transcriptional regulator n=1 Tax=Bacillus cereus TaxID=1396 RepID=UPI0021576E7E|nr:Rha family transcriptional regulator [Bacillus cereus]MDA1977621.1 Rha family transcriptional regulator [Bacillus cereus]
MNKIVFIENNEVVTDSVMVAEVFGKEHKVVLNAIRNLNCSEEFGRNNFMPSTYNNQQNKEMPKFLIKKDGVSFLVMGFTGEKAAQFKEMYIMEFNRMEQELKNRDMDSFMIADPIARAEKWIKEQQEKRKG